MPGGLADIIKRLEAAQAELDALEGRTTGALASVNDLSNRLRDVEKEFKRTRSAMTSLRMVVNKLLDDTEPKPAGAT